MKKNFFKKLSFVMALAMMISVIAPAAGALAATSPALNSTSKYLLLGNADRSEYDFNIKNKAKGWSYNWTSANTAVATVAKNGLVTAEGIGSTKVSVKITKSGKTVATLSAKVVVKDNISAITSIYSQTEGADLAKLTPGTDYDFGRKFKTESGSTTKTTAVTRWVVSEGATITDAGVFNATKAGMYTITAVAFQSKAKYAAWVAAGSDLKSSVVLATKTLEVTVANSIEEVKQISTVSFKVTFDGDMSKTDVTTTSTLAKVINGKEVTSGVEKIKSAVLDTTGKVLTVTTYSAFVPSTTYNFTYGDLKGTFTAAKTDLSEVKTLVFSDFTVNINGTSDMTNYVAGANADGVIIVEAGSSSAIAPYLAFKYDGEVGKAYITGTKNLYVYTAGFKAPITVTYTNYIYNATKAAYETVTATATATATGVTTSVDTATMQFAVLSAAPTTTTVWGATATLAAGDNGFQIYTRYKNNTDSASATYTQENYALSPKFTYESTNNDVLMVVGNNVRPIAAGTATVIVKNNTAPYATIATFEVTVTAARSFATAYVVTPVVTVGNTAYYSTSNHVKRSTIALRDSLGEAFAADGATAVLVSGPSTTNAPTVTTSVLPLAIRPEGLVLVNVNASATTVAGTYNYKIVITKTFNGVTYTKEAPVGVIVADGQVNTTVANWRVDLSDTTVDLKDMAETKNVSVEVNGYNSYGVIVDSLLASEYTVDVKNALATTVWTTNSIPVIANTYNSAVNDGPYISTGLSGSAVLYAYKQATYSVTASLTGTALSHSSLSNRTNGTAMGTVPLTVTDTSDVKVALVAPEVTNSVTTPVTNVLEAVKAAFDFTLNGKAINEANITGVKYYVGGTALTADSGAAAVTSGQYINIDSIEYSVYNAARFWIPGDVATTTVYTIKVGATIRVK